MRPDRVGAAPVSPLDQSYRPSVIVWPPEPPSLLDRARALEAVTVARAAALRLRRAAVDEAERIVAERKGSRA
jgi:hypothetical protein